MKLKSEQFKEGKDAVYIGTFKTKKKVDRFYKNKIRVGGLSVGLLKEYLEKIDNEDAIIGVYIDKKKKQLVPLHCNKIVLAPIVLRIGDEFILQENLKDEGR